MFFHVNVDVGGLIATTHSIGTDAFMRGDLTLSRNGATGSVVNAGELRAKLQGYVALLAPEVRNEGLIVAQKGTVALAAGEVVELQFNAGQQLTGVRVEAGQWQALVDNRQVIEAEDGLVLLSAMAARSLQGGVVRHSGSINASSLTEVGGRVVLTGDDITLANGASIVATGATGGGTVLVGGDWQGKGDMHQASTVKMEQGASINASATTQGDGGKVVLWSDATRAGTVTDFAGSITARGGAQGGDGGKVETSGYTLNVAGGAVNAGADNGLGGLWYLDPADATITQAVADSYRTTLNTGTSVLNDVVGTITWNSGVTLNKTAGGNATLTLRTGLNSGSSNITINTPSISSSAGALNLVLWTRYNTLGEAGTITINGGSITTNGGHMWMGGGNTKTTPWNGLTVGDSVATTWSATTASLMIQSAQINTGTGNFAAYGQAYYSGGTASAWTHGVLVDNSRITTTSGTVYLQGSILGNYTLGSAVDLRNNSSIITTSGSITLRGTASATNSPTDRTFATYLSGKVTLNTDSGAINIYGTNTANTYTGSGIWLGSTSNINATADGNQTSGVGSGYNVAIVSNSGAVLVDSRAQSTRTDAWMHAFTMVAYGADKQLIKTTSGNITIKGDANVLKNDSSGIQLQSNTTSGNVSIVSSSGDIYLQGLQRSRSTHEFNNAIRFTSAAVAGSLRIGAATDATAYTGNITIEADSIYNRGATTTIGAIKAIGTGKLSFTSSGATSVKNFTLTDNWDLGTGHSSITIGKPTENKTITLSAPLNAAGPITVYGGNITLSDHLTSTLAGAKIQLIASNSITGGTKAKIISTNAGDVILASDSDGSGFGNIRIFNGLTIDTRAIASGSTKSTVLTGGGNVTLGGGNAAGTGYAKGVDAASAEGIRVDDGFYINSGGGNITLRGRSLLAATPEGWGSWGVGVWGSGGEFVADAGVGKNLH